MGQERAVSIFQNYAVMTTYSLVIKVIAFCLELVRPFSARVNSFLTGRTLSNATLDKLSAKRRQKEFGAVIFCSSAGEYEQAKPLLHRLQERGDCDVTILVFSQSALDFAQARGESALLIKSPLDTVGHWRRLFAALKPNMAFIVRHELWPGFLYTVKEHAALYLIDATETPSLKEAKMARWLKAQLLKYMDQIFVVDDQDARFYQTVLDVSHNKLQVVGDTKYDRVMERLDSARENQSSEMQAWQVENLDLRRLIVGSGWHEDITIAIQAFRDLVREGKISNWQLVIAPHDISERMIRWIDQQCIDYDVPAIHYTEAGNVLAGHLSIPPVVIVDRLGVLAELYTACHLALVGGAMHHKVHNVLEPACCGLYVTHGSLYKNSREARMLVDHGLVQPVSDLENFKAWWDRHKDGPFPHQAILTFLQQQCGTSDRILSQVIDAFTRDTGEIRRG